MTMLEANVELANLDLFKNEVVLVNIDDFINCIPDVKGRKVFFELTICFVQTCKVKNTVNEEIYKFWGRVNLEASVAEI